MKRGWRKRTAGVVLATAMVVSSLTVNPFWGTETVSAADNLMQNSAFEKSTSEPEGWQIDRASENIANSIESTWGDASTGSNILVVKNAATSGDSAEDFSIKQTISNLPTGSYTFSFWCKGNWAEIYPILDGSIDTENKKAHSENWNSWEQFSFSFTVTEAKTDYVIGVKSALWWDKSLYFDDFELVKLTDGDSGTDDSDTGNDDSNVDDTAENLFTGLNESLTGWTCSNSSAVYENGNIVLSSASGEQVDFYQPIDTLNGKNYTVTVLAKTESTNVWVHAYVDEKWNETYIQATSSGAKLTFAVTGNGEEQNIGVSVWIPAGDSCVIEKILLTKEPDEEIDTSEAVPAGIKIDKISNLPSDFIKGVDVSSYISEKESGVKYYDFEGNELDDQGFFNLLASCGVNYVRIRVWNNPYDENGKGYGGGTNDLDQAKRIGQWVTNAGMKVLIDFHYSDFWTDPGKQYTPKAWEGKTLEEKAEALSTFTKNSLTELLEAGVDVGMVQVGNETNAYFCGEKEWQNICTLFQAGCLAVRDVEDTKYGSDIANGSKIMIALHFADPQTSGRYAGYAENLDKYKVDYDVFASSYYPFFHGTTTNLTTVLGNIAATYGKKVMVAETSWATTLEDGDGHDNQIRVGNNDTPHYEFSVLGQATEVRTVMNAVVNVGEAGIGAFYWEPAWIPVQYAYDSDGELNESIRNANIEKWETYGSGWASSYAGDYQVDAATWYGGSAMDNQAMFDMYGHPLETLKVFNYVNTGTYVSQKEITSATVDAVEMTLGEELESKLGQAKVGFNDATTLKADVVWNTEDLAKAKSGGAGKYNIRGTVTVEVEGRELSKDVSCIVTILPYNYMPNYSLEETNEWIFSNETVEIKEDGNARTGSNALKFYSAEAFSYEAEINVTLDSGVYKFGGYLQGGDVGDTAKFTYSVAVDGGEPITVTADTLKGWKVWVEPSISNVKIAKDGTTVKIKVTGSDIAAGGWGSWDDFYITKDTSSNSSGGSSSSSSGGSTAGGSTSTPADNTVITKNPDGTTTETRTETVKNEAGNEVEVTVTTDKDKEGNVTGSREVSVIAEAAKNTSAVVTVTKDAQGEATNAKAEVTTVRTGKKAGMTGTLPGSVVSQITEAAGVTSTEITVNVTGVKGKTKYTVKVESAKLTAGNELKAVAIDPKTGEYVLVNANIYTVTEDGGIEVSLHSGKAYELVTTEEAAAIENSILETVKVKKASVTVKAGKSTNVQMSSELNMDNVAKITYSSSKKSVAAVSKNGKITAKKSGTVTIKAKVTLNNGKTKTVTMKIKVKN